MPSCPITCFRCKRVWSIVIFNVSSWMIWECLIMLGFRSTTELYFSLYLSVHSLLDYSTTRNHKHTSRGIGKANFFTFLLIILPLPNILTRSCLTDAEICGETPSCMRTVVFKQLLSRKAGITCFCKIALLHEILTVVQTSPLEEEV